MSDDTNWEGKAGNEVRRLSGRLVRAKDHVQQVLNELREAQAEAESAERDLDIAKRMYFAGRQDQEDQRRAPMVTAEKKAWLRHLAQYDVFGAGEMRDAANAIGWNAKDNALRTLAHQYRSVGYFEAVGRGAMRLNRPRIIAVLGDIFSEPREISTDSADTDVTETDVGVPGPEVGIGDEGGNGDKHADLTVHTPRPEDDDPYDDDPPF